MSQDLARGLGEWQAEYPRLTDLVKSNVEETPTSTCGAAESGVEADGLVATRYLNKEHLAEHKREVSRSIEQAQAA